MARTRFFGVFPAVLGMALVALATGHAPLAAAEPDWLVASPLGLQPRTQHAMAYDSARGRVVLFGGGASTGGAYGDTWEWSYPSSFAAGGSDPASGSRSL